MALIDLIERGLNEIKAIILFPRKIVRPKREKKEQKVKKSLMRVKTYSVLLGTLLKGMLFFCLPGETLVRQGED
jgi:hypothetical protein